MASDKTVRVTDLIPPFSGQGKSRDGRQPAPANQVRYYTGRRALVNTGSKEQNLVEREIPACPVGTSILFQG